MGNESAAVIHYVLTIAAINGLDMTDIIFEKDKSASIKYHHETNLEQLSCIYEMIKKHEIID